MESAMRAVETLCFGEVGNVLNRSPFFDIPRLLDKRAVLELDALTNADKTFLIESLLLWIHHYRMGQKDREAFKHTVVIEEAHHILLRKKQEVTGEETVTDILLREIRELGESVICLDQHPSLISKPALGNTYTTFCFNLKHRGDLAMMQDCLLLDSEQTGYLGRLEVGWAVVKLQGRWFFPFLVKLPLFHIKKGIATDSVVRDRIDELSSQCKDLLCETQAHSALISASWNNSGLEEMKDRHIPPFPAKGKREEIKDEKEMCAIQLTTQERDFLMDVWQYPTSAVTERYRRLCFSFRSGHKVQHSLLSNGFMFSSFVILSRGRIKILTLTEEGKQVLGISTDESDRHGGPEHRYWVAEVASCLKKNGFEVATEVPIGRGKTLDVLAERNGSKVVFEVETGKSDAKSNVKKCIRAGFKTVVVVATDTEAERRLKRKFMGIPQVHVVKATKLQAGLIPLAMQKTSSGSIVTSISQ